MDFDGDTASVIRIHDKQAQFEIEKLAHISNNIQYDHNPTFINKCKGEAMYAAYSLLHASPSLTKNPIIIDQLINLPLDDFNRLFETDIPVQFNDGSIHPYGRCIFNRWCGFKEIKITEFVSPNEISKQIYLDSQDNLEYHNRLQEIMVKLFWYSSLNSNSPLTFALSDIGKLEFKEEKEILQKLPNNPYIGQHLYKSIIKRIYKKIPNTHFFGKLLASGLGKVKTQLARISGAIGYISDDSNIILESPIGGNLIDGLNPDDFFNAAMGARKGLVNIGHFQE